MLYHQRFLLTQLLGHLDGLEICPHSYDRLSMSFFSRFLDGNGFLAAVIMSLLRVRIAINNIFDI